jgi:site-specific DNA recombinase
MSQASSHQPSIYQGPARALIRLRTTEKVPRGSRAVIYLRVSTPSQVNTDYDPEGISIPAQRKSCERKAKEMSLTIVREYMEPGRSGTRMDQRPVFRSMLDEIQRERDVDYVIVYELSRMNRNRVDDAIVLMNLRKYGVTLVSATESIDETPVGQLVHGLLATVNEFRSAKDGADIRYKMGEKAKKGGTLGRAKIGYLNVRDNYEGREVRTVTIDPERGPHMRRAFELWATGEYTIARLQEALTDNGLITRGDRRRPPGPISTSALQTALHDPYYCGVVLYDGEMYSGRHEPLISEELFERVQEVFETRAAAGERLRKHPHYLKGSIWCGQCHKVGHESRLLIQRSVGNGGEYFYFFCSRKPGGECMSHYLQVEDVEDAIEHHYRTIRFSPDFAAAVRAKLHETLSDRTAAANLLRDQIGERVAQLDRQEENLYDLAADDDGPKDKLRARLAKVSAQRLKLKQQLEDSDDRLEVGAVFIEVALDLLKKPEELYRRSGPKYRRLLNQAIFEKLYIVEHEVTDDARRQPFAELHEAEIMVTLGNEKGVGKRRRRLVAQPVSESSKAVLLVTALSNGGGSSKTAMVGVPGFEPGASASRKRKSRLTADVGEQECLVSAFSVCQRMTSNSGARAMNAP